MKKLILFTFFTILSLSLASCDLVGDQQPTEDFVATEVAVMLTEIAEETAQAPTPTEEIIPTPTETELIIEETPTETATETPIPTDTATPTPDLQDPAQLLGPPARSFDFSGTSSPWDMETDQATFATSNGYLNMTAKQIANWHSWYLSSPILQNAYVEATIELSTCSGLDRFGLIVRATDTFDEFYYMSITCDGRWGFFYMEPGVNISEIVGYRSADILTDRTVDSIRVGIWMQGDSFTLYIDGEEVGTASDSELPDAGFTGFLIAYANTPGFTVRVDSLKYWLVQ